MGEGNRRSSIVITLERLDIFRNDAVTMTHRKSQIGDMPIVENVGEMPTKVMLPGPAQSRAQSLL